MKWLMDLHTNTQTFEPTHTHTHKISNTNFEHVWNWIFSWPHHKISCIHERIITASAWCRTNLNDDFQEHNNFGEFTNTKTDYLLLWVFTPLLSAIFRERLFAENFNNFTIIHKCIVNLIKSIKR